MKIKAYAVRPDEMDSFKLYSEKLGQELSYERASLCPANADLAKGFDAVTFLGNCIVNEETIKILSELSIKYIASRSAGVNNIDFEAAKKYGIKVSNVPAYSPNSVSEFAVMLSLVLLRKLSQAVHRTDIQNFSLAGLIGRELRNQVVGIVGTGRIGMETAKAFKGFGAKVIGYDLYPNEIAKEYLEYVSLEELISKADIISLHCPLTAENEHMINDKSIAEMKDNVIIINTSRGQLIDTKALISGLYSGKIAAAGVDVYEDEVGIVHSDHTNSLVKNSEINQLRSLSNVVITPHYAFYTDQAVANMVEFSLDSLNQFFHTGNSAYEVR